MIGRGLVLSLAVAFVCQHHVHAATLAEVPAHIDPSPSLTVAEEQFARGEWQNAAQSGERLNSADGLALAARAVLAGAAYEPDRDLRLMAIARALDLANRALQHEHAHGEALLQTAAAYGFRALVNRRADDARLARSYLDRALMAAPANPYVLAGLGSWHGQIVLEAGGFMAGLLFGARRSSMTTAYDAALAIAPESLAIRAGYGLLLLRFDRPAYRDLGLEHLRRASTMVPRGAFERRLLDQTRQILAAYADGASPGDIRAMADATAPFAGLSSP